MSGSSNSNKLLFIRHLVRDMAKWKIHDRPKKDDVKTDDLETALLPSGIYAAFRTERGGLAWEELPKLWDLIFDSWLPNSNYRKKDGPIVEVLHLWTDRAMRRKNRYYEIWVPIENK